MYCVCPPSGDGCRAIGVNVRDDLRSLPILRRRPRRHPRVGNLSMSGELPREAFLLDWLFIGLKKPEDGVRPIAIRETWYRLAGVCALWTYRRGIRAGLAPLQVGVSTPGGTDAVSHALASTLSEDSETVVLLVDMANAVNSFHRAAMFAAVQQSVPALLPMVQWAVPYPRFYLVLANIGPFTDFMLIVWTPRWAPQMNWTLAHTRANNLDWPNFMNTQPSRLALLRWCWS